MPRLLYLTTAPIALRNLAEGQLAFFRQRGYDVTAVASPGNDLDLVSAREGVAVEAVPMEREIAPLSDLASAWRLWRLIRRLRPDVVVASTAKAGLLGMLAARLARVPARIYLLRGLRLETTGGLKRRILARCERMAAGCAHRVICVSETLRQEFVSHGLASADKTIVLLHGSSNGIRADRFAQSPEVKAKASQLRAQWGIAAGEPVIGFVGRFVRDKGIQELLDAFDRILKDRADAWLLLVGDFEPGDPVGEDCLRRITAHSRIIRPGWSNDIAPLYGTMTVLAFPTYREGFPNVVLEAAAAELPVVAFRATGAVDAVADGVTGKIVELGDSMALASALLDYLNDPELCTRHGQAGRARVIRDFAREPLWSALESQFRDLLDRSGK
jgi:glycosyltransferase involved in cell wall biosynthesis